MERKKSPEEIERRLQWIDKAYADAKKHARWELLLKVKGGHKFYAELGAPHRTGRIAIADNSGRYPEDTDDGILFYDPTRDVVLGTELRAFSIPVVRGNERGPGNSGLWTGEDVEHIFDVARVLGFTHVQPGKDASVFQKWVAVKINDQLLREGDADRKLADLVEGKR